MSLPYISSTGQYLLLLIHSCPYTPTLHTKQSLTILVYNLLPLIQYQSPLNSPQGYSIRTDHYTSLRDPSTMLERRTKELLLHHDVQIQHLRQVYQPHPPISLQTRYFVQLTVSFQRHLITQNRISTLATTVLLPFSHQVL